MKKEKYIKYFKYIMFGIVMFLFLTDPVLANTNLRYVSCGNTTGIPAPVPMLTSILYYALLIVTPIIFIIFSAITLTKAIVAQKSEDIMKARTSLIKKLIAGALVFLVAGVVQFVVTQAAHGSERGEGGNLVSCISCFLYNYGCQPSTVPWENNNQ
jgi:Kef-type K+ transport system membrane component KefB